MDGPRTRVGVFLVGESEMPKGGERDSPDSGGFLPIGRLKLRALRADTKAMASTPRKNRAVNPPAFPDSKRVAGRVRCQDIECSLGEILDLSVGGMRVKTSARLPRIGSTLTVTIAALEGQVTAAVTVQWIRRRGWLRREVGLKFGPLDARVARVLCDLARAAAYNETIWRDSQDAGRQAG